MISRFRGLLSRFSLPGWVLLAWIVLGEVHVGTFAVELIRNVTEYLQHHLAVGLVVGFGWLMLAMLWPEWKSRLPPWVKLPMTLHEKVHALETNFKEALSLQGTFNDGLRTVHDNFSERIKTLERDRTGAIGERSGLKLRTSTLERILLELPTYLRFEMAVGDLKARVGQAIEDFLGVQSMYGQSQPVLQPFSAWRPVPGEVPADPAIQMAERLAMR